MKQWLFYWIQFYIIKVCVIHTRIVLLDPSLCYQKDCLWIQVYVINKIALPRQLLFVFFEYKVCVIRTMAVCFIGSTFKVHIVKNNVLFNANFMLIHIQLLVLLDLTLLIQLFLAPMFNFLFFWIQVLLKPTTFMFNVCIIQFSLVQNKVCFIEQESFIKNKTRIVLSKQ